MRLNISFFSNKCILYFKWLLNLEEINNIIYNEKIRIIIIILHYAQFATMILKQYQILNQVK
jgi:hypothetical protein